MISRLQTNQKVQLQNASECFFLPSREPTYPLAAGTFESIVIFFSLFLGYVSFPEGIYNREGWHCPNYYLL